MSEVILDPPVLDLGCGDGMFGSILFDCKPDAIDCGIDLSPEDIQKARETRTYRSLQVADIQRLPFADNSIGSIFSNSVFEHLEDIDSALSEAVRVLKPGGKLVLTSPNNRLVDKFLSARILHSVGLSGAARAAGMLGNRVLGNQTCLSNEQWREKFALAGFSSVDCQY
ncbi:MAG: class I SAM-dependent methyltransferase, partial [Candidatus Abyssubacteria bacterium]|nr:class I SAM-dependent methyltransferase [Candidatus Abyssubacteria bacterium]